MSSTKTFENLPNEILIECLKYFNGWDLFHAFDNLNARFSGLIRSIPLYLNFENVSNSNLQSFCVNIQNNPLIKQQVHSLYLSDEKTLQQAEIFFSYFAPDEFSSLKSLVLTKVESGKYIIDNITENLQLLPDLCCFVLDPYEISYFRMPNNVSLSQIKRLSIPNLCDNHLMSYQQWLTTSLTLHKVSIQQIMKIFQCARELRYFGFDYLEVKNEYSMYPNGLMNLQRNCAIHLKRLRMKTSTRHFQVIEHVLQCTPNLKVLLLIASRAEEMIDADRWETFIRCSLVYLTDFQFQFSFLQAESRNTKTNLLSKFERFQGDFWRTEHQWLVRCEHSASSFLVHTIPYPFYSDNAAMMTTRISKMSTQ